MALREFHSKLAPHFPCYCQSKHLNYYYYSPESNLFILLSPGLHHHHHIMASMEVDDFNPSRPDDDLYTYDSQQQSDIRIAKPWDRDPNYFTHIKISAHALLKMLRHARKGGNLEIMGMLLGKVHTSTMIVLDSFALPVEGTETRVNAHAQAYEYMADYVELAEQVDRKENVIGWYHSHPGYGCWLSGIDVGTQTLNQQFQDPFVAIVIDPVRTISTGKVDIGAFRCYPKNFKPPDDLTPEYQTIPMNKIEDFGVHCKKYYSLEISYFKSELDTYLLECLGNKYWYNTLGTTSLTTNSDYTTRQITDLTERLEKTEARFNDGCPNWLSNELANKKQDKSGDCAKAVIEPITGLMAQLVKNILFNRSQEINKS